MTVRARLVVSFSLAVAFLAVPALFAAWRLYDLRDLAVVGRGRHAEATLAVGRIEAGLAELDAALRGYVATGASGRRVALHETVRGVELEVSRIETAGYQDVAPPLRGALISLALEVAAIDSLVATGDLARATDRVEVFEQARDVARGRLGDVAAGIDLRAAADFERARNISAAALRTTMLALAATILLVTLLSLRTTRALTVPLRRLRSAVAGVTEGDYDLPTDLPYERPDEIGELSASFGIMTRRLAELDRLRAEFLGVASHELKNPINVIRGYAELIEEELAGEVTPRQREIMQRIEEQTRVLTRQVGRLLDISRIESGHYVIERRRIPLVELVGEVERVFEVAAAAKGIHFSTEVAPDAPEELDVDVDLIRDEVLSNIVSNALKFTPSGGRVHLRAAPWKAGVAIEVSDTGPGIPPEHREHIFEKYYQVERSRSLGAGLGLAIARDMVMAHGGSIELVDRPGPGATFRVYLPAPASGVPEEVPVSS